MSEELVVLPSPGALPGIPGEHAPGTYLIDYVARTIRPATTVISETPTEQPVETAPEAGTLPEVVAVPDLPQPEEQPTPESGTNG